MYVRILLVRLPQYHFQVRWLWRLEEVVRSPGTRFTDGSELSCESWESHPGHLELKPVFLISEHVSILQKKEIVRLFGFEVLFFVSGFFFF